MIVVMHNNEYSEMALHIKEGLESVFGVHTPIQKRNNNSSDEWSNEREWNDVLIVLFGKDSLTQSAIDFIEEHQAAHLHGALVIPVAIDPTCPIPPKPLDKYKALQYDVNTCEAKGALTRRIGAVLGLKLQGRDTRIFISYRVTDGEYLSKQLYLHLKELGYDPWLDKAEEQDGDAGILAGEIVQDKIAAKLVNASLVLLIDTPDSYHSKWIREEINLANGMLVPILPVVFLGAEESRVKPRIKSLEYLQRWVSFEFDGECKSKELTTTQLNRITHEIETYLSDIFIRRCRVPYIVERKFEKAGYDWNLIDKPHAMYKSIKKYSSRVRMTVHSHCSAFSEIYSPAFVQVGKFLATQQQANHSLYIYDGNLLPDDELEPYLDKGMTVIHHQEISAHLSSNFTGFNENE
ncbi:toll/interleukin-1 receptor domain-containing protein [Pectobacterium fontis]|uniref:TIR domain-containing protein n=1 Tax=Pectobacterium fontis TaxID=2558042 RepID=A0A7V8L720_9GAMM|nr:toll/interleukin-1 receptor domain-containing protein [Pectobacterium fontis]KHN56272.1 hypothetical protein OI69_01535 [Pectobacterium fontis]